MLLLLEIAGFVHCRVMMRMGFPLKVFCMGDVFWGQWSYVRNDVLGDFFLFSRRSEGA